MTTFALVHGGLHGGWCWERVVPELEARGHRAVAPDLPIDDELAGAEIWAQTVVDAIAAVDDEADADVVVVGHSLGGLCVPVVATLRPVRRMVFLGALVLPPRWVLGDYLRENPGVTTVDNSVGGTPGPAGMSFEVALKFFYQDCDVQTTREAFERLRPQSIRVFTERCPLDRWPDTPSTYILMRDDRAVGPAWSRRIAREYLHADLIEIDGGHSPFYSRPVELAELLVTL